MRRMKEVLGMSFGSNVVSEVVSSHSMIRPAPTVTRFSSWGRRLRFKIPLFPFYQLQLPLLRCKSILFHNSKKAPSGAFVSLRKTSSPSSCSRKYVFASIATVTWQSVNGGLGRLSTRSQTSLVSKWSDNSIAIASTNPFSVGNPTGLGSSEKAQTFELFFVFWNEAIDDEANRSYSHLKSVGQEEAASRYK